MLAHLKKFNANLRKLMHNYKFSLKFSHIREDLRPLGILDARLGNSVLCQRGGSETFVLFWPLVVSAKGSFRAAQLLQSSLMPRLLNGLLQELVHGLSIKLVHELSMNSCLWCDTRLFLFYPFLSHYEVILGNIWQMFGQEKLVLYLLWSEPISRYVFYFWDL